MKKNILLFFCFAFSVVSFAQKMLLPKALPMSSSSMVSMNDDENYAFVSVNRKQLLKADYKTGKEFVVLDVEQLKDSPIESIGGFSFSSDETKILVYPFSEKMGKDTCSREFYIYDVLRSKIEKLSDYGAQQQPTFSPNGKMVAFVRNNDLFIKRLEYGTEVRVTTDGAKDSISNGIADMLYRREFGVERTFQWSPDSKMLSYIKFNQMAVPEYGFDVYKGTSPERKTFKYSQAGEVNATASVHLYNIQFKWNKELKLPDEADKYIVSLQWSTNPEVIAITYLNREQNMFKVLFANPNSLVSHIVYTDINKQFISLESAKSFMFLPDESFVVLSEKDGYSHLYLYSKTGILVRQLTKGNFDVIKVYGYDAANQLLYYQSTENGAQNRGIYTVGLNGKKQILFDQEGFNDVVFSSKYNYISHENSTVKRQPVYTICNKKGKVIRSLNMLSEVTEKSILPQKELFSFTSAQNILLQGWVVKPLSFDNTKKYPLVLFVGDADNFWSEDFSIPLANEGYIVACVNTRGTQGKGEEFKKCIFEQMGKLEAQDQIQTATYFLEQGFVNSQKVSIIGADFGGNVAVTTLTDKEGVIKSAVAISPVTDYSFYNTAYTERFMRKPEQNFVGYEQTSLLSMANQIKGNLLLIQATADENVHLQNTFSLSEKLVEANVQFEMQIYTNDNGTFSSEKTQMHLIQRIMNFLAKK